MTKYQAADQAVQAYDSYVFSSVGRPFDSDRANLLAFYAVEACAAAARDRTVNQVTRDYYASLRDQMGAFA
jgi:hypothetical protein